MYAFLDALRAMPAQQPAPPQPAPGDPRQAQLINFIRAGVAAFDDRQDPIAAD